MPQPQMPLESSPYFDSLVLYGSCDVAPGGSAGPNSSALANPHGLPMELFEVKFRVYPVPDQPPGFYLGVTGAGIGVKFDLGALAVSDSKVPVSGFGNARDDDDVKNDETLIDASGGAFYNPGTFAHANQYIWRLKYPLYIPAGGVLTPVFDHLGQSPYPVRVEVIYLCRTLPLNYRPPRTVMVPWVSSFNSKSFDNIVSAPAGSEISPELDIANNFSVPLEISRLTGRCSIIRAGEGNDVNATEEWAGVQRFVESSMRIRGSRGDEIARVKTIFDGLWPITWRAWDIPGGWIMRPGEFYKIQLDVTAFTDFEPSNTDYGRVQFAVTAVGYRPLDTKLLAEAALQPVPPGEG